jgi:hypothetical protein
MLPEVIQVGLIVCTALALAYLVSRVLLMYALYQETGRRDKVVDDAQISAEQRVL